MAYGDNRVSVETDTFDANLDEWDFNSGGGAKAVWATGGIVEAVDSTTESFQRRLESDFYVRPDQYSTVTVHATLVGKISASVRLGPQPMTWNGDHSLGYLGVADEEDNRYEINLGGIGLLANAGTTDIVAGDTITCEAEGTTIRCGSNEGSGDTQRVTTTDTTFTEGRPGFHLDPVSALSDAQITAIEFGDIDDGTWTGPVLAGMTGNDTAGNSLTLTKPDNVSIGDTLVIIVGNDDSSNTDQWDDSSLKPTGFDLMGEFGTTTSDSHIAAFVRVADGTEGATIAVPAESSSDYWGFYIRITGADTTTPFDDVGSNVETGASSTLAVTGLTPTNSNSLVLSCLAFDGADGDLFSVSGTGWDFVSDNDSGSGGGDGNRACGCFAVKENASGASGTSTFTAAASDGMTGFQFALNPAVAIAGLISPPLLRSFATVRASNY